MAWDDFFNPISQAQAGPLSDARKKLELQKGQQQLDLQKEQARIKGIQAEAEANARAAEIARQNKAADEQAQIASQLKQQQQEKEAEGRPFAERHPFAATFAPLAATLLSSSVPAVGNYFKSRALKNYVGDWEQAGNKAYDQLANTKNPSKVKSTLEAERLRDFENQWPAMQDRYAKGGDHAYPFAAGLISGETALFPTEMDLMNQNNPNKPTTSDWQEAAMRAGIAGLAGFGGTHYAGNLGYGAPVRPYTGGQGVLKAYEMKYPPKVPKSANVPTPKTEGLNAPEATSVPARPSPIPLAGQEPGIYQGKTPWSGSTNFSPMINPDDETRRTINALSGYGQ